ncbi:hypothetical protein RhiirC2_489149 [Rhizophagus irregularis]|uniref:Uncharacterized protein n=1 Tax=Rhizophagus irregularis TaxID=588596 RepID=A0A2N1N7D2_9GLOM|nr:hypothetical protein RhiirC2_489149 [Rhizophagus irregularis]
MCDGDRYLPRIDVSFREMLQSLVSKNNLKFTVFIETPSKPFSDWSVPKVCELYGLSDDPNPSIDLYPIFPCGSADLNNEKSQAVVKHLLAELKLRQKTYPLDMTYEATKSKSYRKNSSQDITGKEISIMHVRLIGSLV